MSVSTHAHTQMCALPKDFKQFQKHKDHPGEGRTPTRFLYVVICSTEDMVVVEGEQLGYFTFLRCLAY